ncbi:erythromycin esterase family protein [Motilibacter aurantiacus]|uniref:erythromycin esterase family protein n=1 Tax=Motilibacter aurantiacus TaxID=2714955 RepID=UPI001409F513|nr:erythromycin esterase family protein [Motilibacter aurantiacus]NHC46918.1 erythromycin esterase family protein [Motilibacter aurantiacus]
MRALARPLRTPRGLDPLLDRVGDARFVLVGEASHGTSEYYRWRAELTRRLISERGFTGVAVEGDWPDCFRVSCSVTGASAQTPREALHVFDRWPTWMWANEEVVDFCTWLRSSHDTLPPERRVGFYGIDVYSLWDSLRSVLDYLREQRPDDVAAAVEAIRCFEPYAEDPQRYARATRLVPDGCEEEVVALLGQVRSTTDGAPDEFAARQNAEVAAGAERCYRAMVRGGPASWNVRDTHMADTLDRLAGHLAGDGGPARIVVWEHNTHVGDARATDMAERGLVNVGQLMRERHGEADVVLVGFGSHHGTVVAGDGWGEPMRVVPVPAARAGSLEALLHEAGTEQALYVFPPRDDQPAWLRDRLDHRAIGVVYRPELDGFSNYVPTVLGDRYDAFVWADGTTALHPLHLTPTAGEMEAFPSGV